MFIFQTNKILERIFGVLCNQRWIPSSKNMNATSKIFLPHFSWFLSYPSNSPYIYLPTRSSLDTIYKVKYRVSQSKVWNSILLPKLFWPTVRKTFEIRGWRPRFCKIFEITRTIYSNSERSEQFLVTECFFNLFLEVSQVW